MDCTFHLLSGLAQINSSDIVALAPAVAPDHLARVYTRGPKAQVYEERDNTLADNLARTLGFIPLTAHELADVNYNFITRPIYVRPEALGLIETRQGRTYLPAVDVYLTETPEQIKALPFLKNRYYTTLSINGGSSHRGPDYYSSFDEALRTAGEILRGNHFHDPSNYSYLVIYDTLQPTTTDGDHTPVCRASLLGNTNILRHEL